MNLKGQINDILNKIQKENKQVNFDSSDLNKRSHSSQRRQSDAGSLIF